MPASAKRAQKTRRDLRRDTAASLPDSSPSRPAKRRKKNDSNPTTPSSKRHAAQPVPPAEVPEEEESFLTADQSGAGENEGDQLVSRVTQLLVFPRDQLIQASKDHANTIHEANSDGVKAYAKIAAQDWTYYITKLEVNIGRPSDVAGSTAKDDEVQIDLGPSKTISRQHAAIYFDPKDEQWLFKVRGRNGAKVDLDTMKSGTVRVLRSGEVIEIAGIEMMFVLPAEISDLNIHESFLRRAGVSPSDVRRAEISDPMGGSAPAAASADETVSRPGRSASNAGRQQAIAPAPPDYRRPGTPPSAARRRTTMVQARSPFPTSSLNPFGGSIEIDLSKDENQHIKPQYSYAQMITQAIMQTDDEKLNLNGIYNFIIDNYAYYRHQEAAGWQNSIRHNLSLNKAFEKVARSTDEPGKGMKWQIVSEHREDMIRNAFKGGRGGHRGSSAPSSPSQLNYITHGPRDMAAREPTSARKRKTSPCPSSPRNSTMAATQSTPDRGSRTRLDASVAAAAMASDGSPLPRPQRSVPTAASAASSSQQQPLSPTLASSFLQDENPSAFVTPAPPRVHPRLAPPSTAPRPSQHMPTSSPAPFWKYADIGSTPLKPVAAPQFDASPSRRAAVGVPPSSSPPPRPTKSSPVSSPQLTPKAANELPQADTGVDVDEDQGFDLTKGFQSIGSYHAPVSQGHTIASANNQQ